MNIRISHCGCKAQCRVDSRIMVCGNRMFMWSFGLPIARTKVQVPQLPLKRSCSVWSLRVSLWWRPTLILILNLLYIHSDIALPIPSKTLKPTLQRPQTYLLKSINLPYITPKPTFQYSITLKSCRAQFYPQPHTHHPK